MQTPPVENGRSSSTTYEWRRVRVRRGAAGKSQAPRSGGRWRRFGRRDPHEWITVRLKYTGGPEGWVLVDGRGERNPYPGYTQLLDLVLDINQAHH